MQADPSETRPGAASSHPIDPIAFAPGTVLGGRYRIVALVGHGGMGEVYRADDLRLGQPVALKFLPASLEADQAARERLLAEVRNARNVSHPNVCRVYDVGDVQGRYFLTMEYIDGEDLASLLRRIGRLPGGKALEIARQLCAGLATAHERGVLHRDLKPANVMIDGGGRARITDFGLAVEIESAAAGTVRAAHGAEVAGTIAYLAPERFEGRPATVQSDLYALGLVLYEIYTGKQALSATTLEGWRRAHSDSTPSDPSTIVSEIDRAVERAILRCLEKDPARRPASAAQLAAALPGGDPLEAAIAAGETPSPELVAASGEEGTLPRAKAWLWFASCLAALALTVPLGSLVQLANLVPLNEPAVQVATARQVLKTLGYPNPPYDSAWWLDTNDAYLVRLVNDRPPAAWFADPATTPRAMVFCYRQKGGGPFFVWNAFGTVNLYEPGVWRADDSYLEFDARGRLLTLRVGGLAFRQQAPGVAPKPADWTPLFAAAGLDPGAFTDAAVRWPPVVTADESRAWEGRVDGETVRVEASAYRGRAVQFLARRMSDASRAAQSASVSWASAVLMTVSVVILLLLLCGFVVLAALARRNVKLGRSDRRGAYRFAFAIVLVEAVFLVFSRHWTFHPLGVLRVLMYGLGLPLFTGLQVWLYYLGLEPFVRRRWPRLLIAWTRLLDGRWRDPLVGRALLAGCTTALVAAAIVPGLASVLARLFGLPIAAPWYQANLLDGGIGWFLASSTTPLVGPTIALVGVSTLLIARFVVRHDRAAWAVVLFVMFAIQLWWSTYDRAWAGTPSFWYVPAIAAAASTAVLAWHGLLASSVFFTVMMAIYNTPLTYDVTRWYAWRTGVVIVLVGGLAFWGFRNVLGRQSAFSVGLDE